MRNNRIEMSVKACVIVLLALGHSAWGHNGVVALAVPVEGIAIDGDLDDWPEGIKRHPIVDLVSGENPTDVEDLSGTWSVAYNAADNALYVAVEVWDESLIIDASEDPLWNMGDGCEIFIDLEHKSESSPVFQWVIWSDKHLAFYNGGNAPWKDVEFGMRRENGRYGYEWRIDIGGLSHASLVLRPDLLIGMDVIVRDRDRDGSRSSFAWGRERYRSGKYRVVDVENRGDVVLAASDTNVGDVQALLDRITARIVSDSDAARSEDIKKAYFQAVFISVPLAFALLHLFLFCFSPGIRENLYYTVCLCALAAWIFYLFRDVVPTDIDFLILFMIALLRLVYSIFHLQLPRLFWGFLGVGVIIAAGLWYNLTIFFPFFVLFCLVLIFEVLRTIVVALYQKKEGARLIGSGFALSMLAFLNLMLSQLGILPSNIDDFYIAIAGISAVTISMSLHLARKFAHTNRDLETQLVQVQALSDQAIEQERRIREEEVQRQLLEEELQTAQQLQASLMPAESPSVPGCQIAGRCLPATHVGGDFFQYFERDGTFSVCLSDVTGHAMEAAVPVMMFSGVLKTEMRHGAPVDQLFNNLNNTMHDALDDRTFVCFAMGEVDLATCVMRLANGGCPYPFHFHNGEIGELEVDAYPLGVRAEASYRVVETALELGDYVVFCSDGIIEAANIEEEIFGFEQTAATIRAGCAEGLSAEALIDRLIGAVQAFAGDEVQGDDMTCVVVRVE